MTGFQSSLQFYRGQPALPGGVQGFFSSLWEIFITDLDTSGIGAPWSIFLKILTSANISTGCYDCSHHLHYSFIIVSTLCSSGISDLIDSKRAIIQSYNSAILRLEEAFLTFLISRNRFKRLVILTLSFPSRLVFLVCLQVLSETSAASDQGCGDHTPAANTAPTSLHQGGSCCCTDNKWYIDRAYVPRKMKRHHLENCLRPYWKIWNSVNKDT